MHEGSRNNTDIVLLRIAAGARGRELQELHEKIKIVADKMQNAEGEGVLVFCPLLLFNGTDVQ